MQQAFRILLSAAALAAMAARADADVITDWNVKAGDIVGESKLGTPPAIRVMAMVQSAVQEAVDALDQRASAAASIDAAVAAANRITLTQLLPSQQAAIEAAYTAALAKIADGPAKAAGAAAGERAAAAVLAARAEDNIVAADAYRPHAGAGAYVPTVTPAAAQWPQRKPWLMASAAQFRPAPPPPLNSELWARDVNEVKLLGAKASTRRSTEQTDIARFWEYSLPPIYYGVVRSLAQLPERDVKRNARLYAAAAQAMDDAMISVFDAKYHYNFWRPVTAIRNGDADGHDGTARDVAWAPLIDNPMHPEYPSAHSILASAVGAVLRAEIGSGSTPSLQTSSPSAKGATRRWSSVDEFVREVASARVYEGVHYRFSTTVGIEMGQKIGELAVSKQRQLGQ